MFKKLLLEQVISFENSFNGFIYYLRESPFFEKRISYEFFQHNKFKKVLSIAIFIFGILMKFLGRLAYATVFLLIPYIILKQFVMGNTFEYEETVINIFFMMNCVCGSLVNTVMLSSSDEDYMMLNLLKISPKEHYVGELFFKLITDFGIFFVVLAMFDIGVINSLVLVIIMTAFRCIGEALSLVIYEKIPFLYKRIVGFDVVIILVCVYFAYVNPYRRGSMVSVDAFAFNPMLMGIIIALGIITFIVLCTYKKYPKLARKTVKRVDVEYAEEIKARTRIRDVEAVHSETGSAALYTNRHEKKSGYAYMNHIFFDRNKAILLKSPNKRIVWIVLISVLMIFYVLSVDEEARVNVWNVLLSMDTIWFLLMYILSSSHRMCRAIFYNCDKDMMSYAYYRKKSALVENYLVRLKKFILMDLRVPAISSVAIVLITFITGNISQWKMIIPVIINAFLASIIASIYHVSMYHVFQPYDEQMKVRMPLFTIANVVVGVIGLIFWNIPFNGIATVISQVITICGVFVLTFILVKQVGSKNFYVKK